VTGTLKISGKLDKYSPKYELNLTYIDKASGKTVNHQVEPNVATWFTTKGVMVSEAIDKDFESYITILKNKLHQN
jgi:signal peptidase complex subunit 2